jgi:hypothetical protein
MMKRVPLKRNSKLYEEFFCNQAGHGIPVFVVAEVKEVMAWVVSLEVYIGWYSRG